MKKQKSGFLLAIAVLLLLSGCKSEILDFNTRSNPSSAPASAITVAGNVIDSKTSSGLTGATVDIFKTDGTKVATVTSGASGAFSYDLSGVKVTSVKISASASGYGYSFAMAAIDTAKKTASVVSIPLDQIATTSKVITTTGGTVTTTTSSESKNNAGLTATIPPGAVTTSTTIQMATVPVNNVPAPQNSASSSQVGVASLLPAGVTFAAPITLSFPLPYKFKANDQVSLAELVNNVWQVSTVKATVDATGYIATVNVSKTGQYSLQDNTSVSGTVTMHKAGGVLEERSFTFTSGILKVELPGVLTYTRTSTNVITEVPSDEWIFNTLAQRFGARFATAGGPGATPVTVAFNVAWPGPAANPNKLNADGSGNAYRPFESGSWSIKVTYESYTDQFANAVLDNPGYWQVTVTGSMNNWREKSRVWVWTAHNQGGVFEY